MFTKYLLVLFASILQVSCMGDEERSDTSMSDSANYSDIPAVKISAARRTSYPIQIISNGKVFASREVQLSFNRPGVINRITVRNGDFVRKGQLLASLYDRQEQQDLLEARLKLEESVVEINDQLITQGGSRSDSMSVSKDVYKYIKLKSGFDRANLLIKRSMEAIASSSLFAPADGIIANLEISQFNATSPDKPICLLLDTSEMLVHCTVMETEIYKVQIGQNAGIELLGLPQTKLEGRIINVNPIVSKQGLINTLIKITNPTKYILSGMNVRVIIEHSIGEQLTVPKSAVVERSGRNVVFVFNEGIAEWRYVKIGLKNDNSVIITEGLNEGEKVIISGNLNLGHDAKVRIDGNDENKQG